MEFKSPTGRSHVHSIPIGERLRNSLSLSFAICKVGTGAGGGRSDKSWAPVPAVHQPILTPTQQDPHQTWWAWHARHWPRSAGEMRRDTQNGVSPGWALRLPAVPHPPQGQACPGVQAATLGPGSGLRAAPPWLGAPLGQMPGVPGKMDK